MLFENGTFSIKVEIHQTRKQKMQLTNIRIASDVQAENIRHRGDIIVRLVSSLTGLDSVALLIKYFIF